MAAFFVAAVVAMFSHELMATCVHKHVETNTAIAANHIPWAHLWSNHRDKGVFTADIRIVNREHWYVYELQHTETRSTIDALEMRQQPVVVVVAFFSSSSSSTHFKTVHFARSLTHSLFHWFSQLLNVYKSERKWMKFICLQSLLFEFSHMVFTHSLIRSLVVCCSLLAVTSHTINSLLHYTWNECGSLGVNGEETFIGKHHSKYKVLHKKNCDDMLHFRNRALTSKPIFLQFHLLFFSLSLHNFILYLLGCFFFFRWLFSFWISFYTFLWLYTVILFIFSLALLFSILSFHFVAPLHLVYSFSRDNVARVR